MITDIEEIKKKKYELEHEIANKLTMFSNEFNCDIDLEVREVIVAKGKNIYNVKIKLVL